MPGSAISNLDTAPGSPYHRGEMVVALTFDDGPSPVYTPQILRILAAARAPASFEIIGMLGAAYPGILRAVANCSISSTPGARLGDRGDHRDQAADHDRGQAQGQLVDQQVARLRDQRLGQYDILLLAAGQGPGLRGQLLSAPVRRTKVRRHGDASPYTDQCREQNSQARSRASPGA